MVFIVLASMCFIGAILSFFCYAFSMDWTSLDLWFLNKIFLVAGICFLIGHFI